MNQNLPNMLDITSIDSMVFAADRSEYNRQNITLADTDDFFNASAMVPVDQDYTVDGFGQLNPDESKFFFEDHTMARPLDTMIGKEVDTMHENFLPEGVTSTTRKEQQTAPRLPFGDLSNMQEIARQQDATLVAENQAMTFVFDQTNFPGDVAEPVIPNLFEPTMASFREPEPPLEIQPVVDFPETATERMVRSVSADINALKDAKKQKLQAIVNRKRKIDLIIDNATELVVTETEKIRRINKPYRPGTEEYKTQLDERRDLFRTTNPWQTTKHDYRCIDLFKQPRGLFVKRTANQLSQLQQSFSINVKILEQLNPLKTGKILDDEHFYLTQAHDANYQGDRSMSELMVSRQERARKANVSEQEKLTTRAEELKKSSRQSSIYEQSNQNRLSMVPDLRPEEQSEMPFHMEQPNFEPILMQAYETILETNMTENNQTGFLPNQTVMEGDKTNFEAIIMKRFGGEASQIVLQDLIQASKIPDRFKNVQKPRKFFAAKMFLTALNLAGKREITLKQNRSEGPIFMRCA